jgi:hypothetical protein
MLPNKLRIALKHYILSLFCLCTVVIPISRPYPMSVWALEDLAQSPVLVTVKIEKASPSSSPVQSDRRTIPARATLLVLRCFPPLVVRPGERIDLTYESLAGGHSGMNGPAVPNLRAGSIVILPLKSNPRLTIDTWRLVADEGGGLVVPAIERYPAFFSHPTRGREYLLQEIASALANGTREEVTAESRYFTFQKTNGYGADLMALVSEKVDGDVDRLALIAAAIVSSLGTPRPTIGEFRARKYASDGAHWAGSLAEAAIQRLGKSTASEEKLIRQLLDISDLDEWGAGVTLAEFAQQPNLVVELRTMLKSRRPGSLYVAYGILKAGQRRILPDAISAAFDYLDRPRKDHSETQAACWVVRDFGSDEQFRHFVRVLRKYQFQDQAHYDELWRDTVWSDNDRERVVLEILLADERVDASGQRYSDIARSELDRLAAKPLIRH